MPHPIIGHTAAAIALCLWVHPATAQSLNDTTLLRKIEPAQLTRPAPSAAGLLGYPAITVDKRVVRQLLLARSFDELDRMFTDLEVQVGERIQSEYAWVTANRAFATADSTLEEPLNAWVAASPASSHALAARATYLLARAWQRRGTNYIRETTGAAIRAMNELAAQSAQDAMAALQRDSTNLVGYGELIDVLQLSGDTEGASGVYQAGQRHFRGSYYLADTFMNLLEPRWGGSFEQMDRFASQVASDSGFNPRLATLLGSSEAERARQADGDEDYTGMLAHINNAFQYGPEIDYYLTRGDAYNHLGNYGRAIEDINTALSVTPQNPRALQLHGIATMSSADWQVGDARVAALNQAKSDFELLLSFDPKDDFGLEQLPRVKASLRVCPRDWHLCPQTREPGTPSVDEIKQMRTQLFRVLGIALVLSSWGIYRWIKSGFWIPRYIHLLAALALFIVCFIDVLWIKAGGKMTIGRWTTIPIFPFVIYFIFIGLGGVVFSPRPAQGRTAAPLKPKG